MAGTIAAGTVMSGDQQSLLHSLAYLYLAVGQPQRAVVLLRLVEQAMPQDGTVLRMLAYALSAAGEHTRALSVIDRMAAHGPPGAGTLLLRSRALHRSGQHEEARRTFADFVAMRAAKAAL